MKDWEDILLLLKNASLTSVIGDWAAGKSTLAVNLAKVTKQELVHLNLLSHIRPGKNHKRKKVLSEFRNYLNKKNCILDGNLFDVDFDKRLKESDAIVFFDGNNDDIVPNYMERFDRVVKGQEERIGAVDYSQILSYEQIEKSLANRLKKYKKQKEALKIKLEAYGDKVAVIKDYEEAHCFNELLLAASNNGGAK